MASQERTDNVSIWNLLFRKAKPAHAAPDHRADSPSHGLSAQERALDDDRLVAYGSGKLTAKGEDGRDYRHGTLFRGNHAIHPTQFDRLNRELEQSLNRAGGKLAVDGQYGAEVEAGVRALQKDFGLHQDGMAGRRSIAALQLSDAEVLLERLTQSKKLGTAAAKRELGRELKDIVAMGGALSSGLKERLGMFLGSMDAAGISAQDGQLGGLVSQLAALAKPAAKSPSRN